VAMEGAGISGEILDADWKVVFISSEEARIVGVAPEQVDRFYGKSLIVRNLEDADVFGITDESSREWWQSNVPIMRYYLSPEDARFDEIFGALSEPATKVEPVGDPPRAWSSSYEFPPDLGLRQSVLGDVTFLDLRIDDDDGQFLAVVRLARTAIPESLLTRLGRGDRGLYERMDHVRDPARRAAAILFADLEASGALSRRLSSRGYFGLIGGLTDLIDSAVIARNGIVGKHAGDGGSALFLVLDFGDSESATARAAIEAARAIRDGAAELGAEELVPQLNIGLHWGGTLMVGQVATNGRLEVTALGDPMNEAARIEAAASEGSILASKELIERLDPGDASATGIDPDGTVYLPLGEREGISEKALRDAGTIPVAEI
jgi:class 3 adenylate cyclase